MTSNTSISTVSTVSTISGNEKENDINTVKAVATIYTKPACVQCNATHLALDKAGIPYVSVNVTTSPASLEHITEELGYSQAPVVIVNEDEENHWSGFRPDKIVELVATLDAMHH